MRLVFFFFGFGLAEDLAAVAFPLGCKNRSMFIATEKWLSLTDQSYAHCFHALKATTTATIFFDSRLSFVDMLRQLHVAGTNLLES